MHEKHKEIFNKSHKAGEQDTWLTPPELLAALGPFDTDPCCPQGMAWSTARRMVSLPEDGLAVKWAGRIWVNPPYSAPLPWVQKMVAHNNGIMLLPANTDTRYAQLALKHAQATFFVKGRLLFHYVDGTCSKGKWMKNMLCAFGDANAAKLKRAFERRKLGAGIFMSAGVHYDGRSDK